MLRNIITAALAAALNGGLFLAAIEVGFALHR